MKYKSGYKYQLAETYSEDVGIYEDIKTKYMDISDSGILLIRDGYAWDGPSGPTIDTDNFMIGSLVHDALYQLIRMGKLTSNYRLKADDLLYKICIREGMSKARAWYVRLSVRVFGKSSADPKKVKKIIEV